MNPARWYVHFAGSQKVAWALDEDLLWLEQALGDRAKKVSLPFARIVHAAWWPAVLSLPAPMLAGKNVVSFADNPPSFYLSNPGFAKAAGLVNLWIARTREAEAQFQCLGLPVARAPYCADPGVFKPLPNRAEIRAALGIPEDSFVIGNFHRDSEGANLRKPKLQKGPDVFLEVAKALRERKPRLHVLLAGPRRHWLRNALAKERIPFTFAGEAEEQDDYPKNILNRPRLNELYQALDVCVISSRWEGGPYSVLEALFSGTAVVSTHVGLARDLLLPEALYRTPQEGAEKISSTGLTSACKTARKQALQTNTLPALRSALIAGYSDFPAGGPSVRDVAASLWQRVSNSGAKPESSHLLSNIIQKVQAGGDIASETPLENDAAMKSALIQTARHWRTLKEDQ